MKKLILQAAVLLGVTPVFVLAGKLTCPDVLEDTNQREVMATSSPEVKVKASLRNEGRRWIEVTKPLTQKALKLAKAQRALAMQEGIENRCGFPNVYVGQIPGTPEKPTACTSKIVTRPADNDQMWIQVVASCKYTWSCCTPEELPAAAPAKDQTSVSTGSSAGYAIEGPLNPNTSKSKQHSAADVSSSPSANAPAKIKP